MPAWTERSAAAARQHQRQVSVVVGIAIAKPTAVRDHRVIKQRSIAIGRRLQLFQQIRELFDVETIDLGYFGDPLFITLMMSQAVMRFRDADLGIRTRALLERQ